MKKARSRVHPATKAGCIVSVGALVLSYAGIAHAHGGNLLGPPAVCPRNPIGGALQDSVHVFSQNGVLEMDLYYATSTDSSGNQVAMGDTQMPYYCFLTKDGDPAPIPHLKPGDTFIGHYHNLLP